MGDIRTTSLCAFRSFCVRYQLIFFIISLNGFNIYSPPQILQVSNKVYRSVCTSHGVCTVQGSTGIMGLSEFVSISLNLTKIKM